MSNRHCWDIRDCGKGPGSANPCIVTDFNIANGFLNGENGSRACFYIRGTICYDDDEHLSIPEKLQKYCLDCEVYKNIIFEYGIEGNLFYYLKFIHDKLTAEDRMHELPMFQENLFQISS